MLGSETQTEVRKPRTSQTRQGPVATGRCWDSQERKWEALRGGEQGQPHPGDGVGDPAGLVKGGGSSTGQRLWDPGEEAADRQ